jgi:ABC transporter substrate binding protein
VPWPAKAGDCETLNWPGGNITGVSFFSAILETKRLGLLSQLVPNAHNFGVLINPSNANAEIQLKDVEEGGRVLGRPITTIKAVDENEIEAGFETLAQRQTSALLVAADPFFFGHREKIVALAGVTSCRRFTSGAMASRAKPPSRAPPAVPPAGIGQRPYRFALIVEALGACMLQCERPLRRGIASPFGT